MSPRVLSNSLVCWYFRHWNGNNGNICKQKHRTHWGFLQVLRCLTWAELMDSPSKLHTLSSRCAEDAGAAVQLLHAVDTCSRRHLLQHPAPLLVLQHGPVCTSTARQRCLSEEHGLSAGQAQCGSVGPHLPWGSVAPFPLLMIFSWNVFIVFPIECPPTLTEEFGP